MKLSLKETYNPKEDSFFLLELLDGIVGKSVLEIGCNEGFILSNFASKDKGRLFVGIDILLNPMIKKKYNNSKLEFIQADGRFLPFRKEAFDLVFFNPPYLPSSEIVDVLVDGGKEGIELTLEFLKSLRYVLKPSGLVVFISSTLSNLKKLEKEIKKMNFKIIHKKEKRLFFEKLVGYYLKRKFLPDRNHLI